MTSTRQQLDELIQLYQSGQLTQAASRCRHLLGQDSSSFALHNLLGLIYQGLGKLQQAVDSHGTAIELEAGNAKAYTNRGMALLRLGQFGPALADFDRAIELKPELDGAHFNRGLLLRKLGKLHAARQSYEKAILLNPELDQTHANYGNVLKDLGKIEDAILSYQRAIALSPDNAQAHSNLLMAYNYLPTADSAEVLQARKAFATALQQTTVTAFRHPVMPAAPQTLRVGLVSGDLRNHPVGYLLEDVLTALKNSRLELIAFSTTGQVDELSKRIRPQFKDWLPLYDKSTPQAAQLIHDQQIDILVDLAGHTANNRLPLFQWQAAPVQISWLGYFASTGLDTIDYCLTDPHLSPAQSDSQFSEQLWRLPETRWCFSRPAQTSAVSPLPAQQNGFITFACFHNLAKINRRVIALWAAILNALPTSKLLIKNGQMRDPQTREDLLGLFAAHGVQGDRLEMEEPETREQYLQSYQRVDIQLDPFPFAGGVTSIESLWMGVPFISMSGETLAARQGVSILTNVGLAQWIADNEQQYLETVIDKTRDLDTLASLRQTLRSRLEASPLMDAERFAENFEQALFTLWHQTARARSC